MTYLGFNLTPDAIAGLQGRADQLNSDAQAVFAAVDSTLTAAEAYKATVTTPAAPQVAGS